MRVCSILTTLFLAAFALIFANQKPAALEIKAYPIQRFNQDDPARIRFGVLEFRGGLVLTSSSEEFGGISALRVQPDGSQFIALTDRGFWLRGRIVYKGNRPVRIDASMAPFLGPPGKAPARWDTESIAENGGTLYVGIERENLILELKYPKAGFPSDAAPIEIPSWISKLPNNQGLEALVYVPAKLWLGRTLIAFSEHDLNEDGNLKACLIGGPKPGPFTVTRTSDYDISDAALLPGGDLLILERKYSVFSGPSVRIRRIRLTDIKPGALVDGPVIFEADNKSEIDNMEAISVHRARSGEIILTLMSDNNLSSLQRTILLQFAYIGYSEK